MASNHGIVPFAFQPKYDEAEDQLDSDSTSSKAEETVDNTVRVSLTRGQSVQFIDEWCHCECCSSMNLMDSECVCCTEWARLDERLNAGLQCVTGLPYFAILCLNHVVLLSMWPYIIMFKGHHEPIPSELANRYVCC